MRKIELADEAFYGIAGEFARTISDGTEADPGGVLLTFLVCVGTMLGRDVYNLISRQKQYPNLFLLVIGRSALGRKSFSVNITIDAFEEIFPAFVRKCKASGLVSGEGIVDRLHDPKPQDDEEEATNLIELDKRLLVIEDEFGGPLSKMGGEGNILSQILRSCFDGRDLETMGKTRPQKASNPHVSLIGSITGEELQDKMPRSEWTNGFANRLLFCWCESGPILADPPEPDEKRLKLLFKKIQSALSTSFDIDNPPILWHVRMNDEAKQVYRPIYEASRQESETAAKLLTHRAANHLRRLALIFAVLDRSQEIRPEHINAANAIIRYSEQSIVLLFGERLANAVSDAILTVLAAKGEPMSRTDISRALFGKVQARRLSDAFEQLCRDDYVTLEHVKGSSTGGRSKDMYDLSEKWRSYTGLA